MKFLASLIAAMTLVGCADAASPSQTLPQFEKQLIQQLARGQWKRLYRELHPAQQRIISRSNFSRCMDSVVQHAANHGVNFSSQRFVRAKVEPKKRTVSIPGTSLRVEATAVRTWWSIVAGGARRILGGNPQNVVSVNGGWRWLEVGPTPSDFKKKGCGLPR